MPSEHMAGVVRVGALTNTAGAERKLTCDKCHHTVYETVVDGAKVLTDSELITVVPAGKGVKRRDRSRINGRRLHAESCERLARQVAREQAGDDQDTFNRRAIARLASVADDIRNAAISAQASLRRITPTVEKALAPAKRSKRTRGM